jgi:predicted small metal-binding protein
MNYKLACDCGWETEGAEAAIVEATQEHGRQLHNMELTFQEALAMAQPLED